MAANRLVSAPPAGRPSSEGRPEGADGEARRPELSWRPLHPFTAAIRLCLLVLVALLGLAATRDAATLLWPAMLALIAIPAVGAARHPVIGPLTRFAEVVVTCLAADSTAAHSASGVGPLHGGAGAGAYLPYLLVPVLCAVLYRRIREAVALTAFSILLLFVLALVDDRLTDSGYLVAAGEWLVLLALSTAVAATLRRNLTTRREPPPPQPYAEATRLLTQLRTVARQLPGATLDPVGLAQHLLDEVRRVARADRGSVLAAGGGSRLVVLAQLGLERIDWETDLDSDSVIADAWASQQPQTGNRSQARSHPGGEVSTLVIPLMAGVRTVGVLSIEADAPGAYPASVVSRVTDVCAPAALRLEAALLFDEVRSLATNEERQRLAREIHDGVAQELVMVGYGIDNAMAVLPEEAQDAQGELRTLRNEVTRVITELRMSLFELRTEVDRHGGLSAAIAEYARTMGTTGGMRVHLSLDDTGARLPAATEAELLRIAQEAITNARKHSGAANLWVTCAVDPPFAMVEISDDGQGMVPTHREGHYGLTIMAERAERVRGRLEIRRRDPHGTTVAVVLGTPHRRGNL
jgi:signal transduction histidine kinase